jgi:hypothetical protein
LPVGNFFL